MDKSTALLEQDLYFDDNITLERLSHPVSGKEFLTKVMYPRFWFWVPRGISHILAVLRNEPKELLAKQTRLALSVLLIVIGLVVWTVFSNWGNISEFAIAMYTGNLAAVIGGGAIALAAISLAAFRNLRAIIPLIPESKNITLDEYDGHNIGLLIQSSSPKWLNRELYDDAWPVYNGRRNGGGNDTKFQDKIKLSQDNVQQLEGWVEDFLKQFVNGNVYFENGTKQLTRVQRSLVVLWVINPPKETSLSGVNHQRFSDYAHRVFAESVINILSNLTPEIMKEKKISPNTMDQCLSQYEVTSGTLDAQFTQTLIDDLFKPVAGIEPVLQKILKRLIT